MKDIDKEEYIKSLENLLIFMCKTYDDIDNELLRLANEENNRAFFEVPRVQGLYHVVNISKIGELEFEEPLYSFKDVYKVIESKNK